MYQTERDVLELIKRNNIEVVSTLPCEKLSALLRLVADERAFCHVGLNREENGVGISAGVSLAGGRPLMIIQSTGLGNSLTALMSLTVTYGLPLPIIASWRGVYKEQIEAQVPFGKALPGVLDALGLNYTLIEDSSQIGLVDDAIQDAFAHERPHIALISPRTWGSDEVSKENTGPHRKRSFTVTYEGEYQEPEMRRYDAIRIITEYLDEEAVIANIGVPSKELYAAQDRALNFYMLGSLGQASSIGLGVALKTNKPLQGFRGQRGGALLRETVVLDGDGSLLMSDILPVVGEQKPKNLSIICLDNGTWGSTGDQPVAFAGDIALMAIGAGMENTMKIYREEELRHALEGLYEKAGPRFLQVVIKPGNAPIRNIPLSASQIKRRFMAALLP
ncbi:MAG: sulfopyruvate decarboxylase subunit alpha [Methanophagales archaeon ANME-1-THS]|nr:MAG: sulfopyruvate decarboxylase subunit alpha [Methanophagales archaeon ANME-1-THS]